VAGERGRSDGNPTAPGWYPDPWSATGEGERYFDGKRWGTTEKPLARHTVAVREHRPPKPDRFRRVVLPITILVVLVGATWAIPKFLNNDSGNVTSTAPRSLNAPPPSGEEAARPLGRPGLVPAGSGRFEFLIAQPGDAATPVAFDPCRPVHYVVNPAGAPSDGLALIQHAVARVSTATGLKFVYDGVSNETPDKARAPYQPDRYGKDRWAPVLISWSDEASFPKLAGYVAGVGRPLAAQAPSGRLVYVSGDIVLDAEQLSAAQLPDRGRAEATILHEFGHLVGLDHTNDRTQLMFSEAEFNVADYGDGDLRGLARLGTQSCFPNV
jgi:Protein of unknown function (DUF2510)/Matrixin